MKTFLCFLLVASSWLNQANAACSACSGGSVTASGNATGPSFRLSLGSAQPGQPAGHLTFGSSVPSPILFTPMALGYDAPTLSNVTVVSTSGVLTNAVSSLGADVTTVTNITYITNFLSDGTATVFTNTAYTISAVTITNTTFTFVTKPVIRQVHTPMALADVPPPPTTNGFVINFYWPAQVGPANAYGVYAVSGTPFATVLVTNPAPSGINQLLVSESTLADGLLKQTTYTYNTNTDTWVAQSLGGIVKSMTVVSLDADDYQVINTLQYAGGPVVQQTATTYQNLGWTVAPVQIVAGTGANPQVTTYSYWPQSSFATDSQALPELVTHPNGSWEYYAGYTTNGIPSDVFYGFGDAAAGDTSHAREIQSTFDLAAVGQTGSGDNIAIHPTLPRMVVEYLQGTEVSRRYSLFPSVGVRLDIQCVTAGAAWNASDNLITTNLFYTNGPNQFALQSVLSPDGTMTFYNYLTNALGLSQTNIVVSGQPDPTDSYIVDGVSNQMVINQAGNLVSSGSWDVKTGLTLSQDGYGNFDAYGRPQQVTHLDGTVETNVYACCGLSYTINRDGLETVYLYDADRRQVGYEKIYNGQVITYNNALDAAGRTVQSSRLGSDGGSDVIIQSQSAYDTAGRLLAQTNALNGATAYVESADPVTGALVRSITYPNGGTRIEAYYADGSLKSVTGTAVHGQAYGYGVEYNSDLGANCSYTVVTNLDGGGNPTAEWVKTYTDLAGRTVEKLYAGNGYNDASGQYHSGPNTISYYNAVGQLWKQVDPDGVTQLFTYNSKGDRNFAITAVTSGTQSINDYPTLVAGLPGFLGGTDRVSQSTNDVTIDHGVTVRRSQTFVWLDGQGSGTLAGESENSADGLGLWQTTYRDSATPVTTATLTSYGNGSRTIVNTAADGSRTVNQYGSGRQLSSTRFDANGVQLGGTSYTYDPHDRQQQVTDARNGATTYVYNAADLVTSVTSPAPGNGSAPETTTTLYDPMLRPVSVTQPDGTTVTSVYLLTGELGLQYGSRTYPVAYTYDYAGRMQSMTNWSGFNLANPAGARVTTWSYDSQRGWLLSKTYADNHGTAYAYTPAGRLQTRTWARTDANGNPITTTYGYDLAGGLNAISYSDTTPAVAYTYDRLGRQSTLSWNGITDTQAYNLAGQPLFESFAGGPLSGLGITNQYDTDLRRTKLSILSSPSTILAATAYGYDAASRLATVADGHGNTATYNYLANSPLVSQIAFQQNGATRVTTTKTYDDLNRLTQMASQPGAAGLPPVAFNYSYNSANQRTQDQLADGSYWVYQYDSLGQVISGHKYFRDGTPMPGQQFDYGFDTIGNRTQTRAGGDQTGGNQRLANYSVNNLNQITSRDLPGASDIVGAALATNSVTLNGQPAGHKWEYYWGTVNTNNTAAPAWLSATVASGGASNTGSVYLARTPEQFSYDADGNLTNDGRWAYTWDAENRLIGMTVNTSAGPQYQLTFAYDPKGRRIQKTTLTNGISTTINFLYDGWNLVAVLNPQSALLQSFVWGSDLSGSPQGAGGVGGLLEVSYYGATTTNCVPAYDGNGNVAALINAADGTLAANYEYGPFGEVIRATGPLARVNPIRFSTKYQDDESDLLYYGYRYYKPSTGTWPNRDPLEELGFKLVCLNRNSSTDIISEQLLSTGMSLLQRKDWLSLLQWLLQLSTLQELGIKPYEKNSAINVDSGKEANDYIFNSNDAIDKIDDKGLKPFWLPFYYRCPATLCSGYVCSGVFNPVSLPKAPPILIACLYPTMLVMNSGCAWKNFAEFKVGCKAAQDCFTKWW